MVNKPDFLESIDKEIGIPDYPKHLERKIVSEQRKKETYSFYYNLNKTQKIDIALVLIAIFVCITLFHFKPTMAGFYLNDNFEQEISCGIDCAREKIGPNTRIDITIQTTSYDEGTIKAIYPASWQIIDADQGYISVYDENNYQIGWEVGEGIISKTYSLISPDSIEKYSFRAGFNEFILSEKTIKVEK